MRARRRPLTRPPAFRGAATDPRAPPPPPSRRESRSLPPLAGPRKRCPSPRVPVMIALPPVNAVARGCALLLCPPASRPNRRTGSSSARWLPTAGSGGDHPDAGHAGRRGRNRRVGSVAAGLPQMALYCETDASLRSSPLENSPPIRGRHAAAEAVNPLATALLGLIGALWQLILTSALPTGQGARLPKV